MLVSCKMCGIDIESKYGKKVFCCKCLLTRQRRKKRIKDNLKKGIILEDPDKKERKCINCNTVFEYVTHPSPRCNKCKKEHRKKFIEKYVKSDKVIAYRKKYGETRRREVMEQYKLTDSYKKNIKLRRWRRKQYLKNIEHDFTYDEWLDMVDKTNGVCPGCNIDVGVEKLTLDHIYPVSVAYKDYIETNKKRIYTIKDVQPLCSICNGTKNAKIPEELK